MKPLLSIPLLIEERSGVRRILEPVTVGIPLSKGAVFDPCGLVLCDPRGQARDLQARVLARWWDDSIKWVLLDFQASVEANAIAEYLLQYCQKPPRAAHGITVRPGAESVVVDTGGACFFINTRRLKPFDRVVVRGSDIVAEPGSRIVLADALGREYAPTIRHLCVETAGPLRTTLTLQGTLCSAGQQSLAEFICHLRFFAGHSLVELQWTLRNPRAAQHPGGFWDLGDNGSIYFKDLSLHTPLASDKPCMVSWTLQPHQPLLRSGSSRLEIYQDSSGGDNWNSSNHVNRFGNVMHTFQGFRVTADGVMLEQGKRATPVVYLQDGEKSMAGAIVGFWQNFPKAIEVQNNVLSTRLFPPQYRDVYELQGGEQKTHTIFLQFSDAKDSTGRLDWIHDRLIPRTTPQWFAKTRAFDYVIPRAEHEKTSPSLTSADNLIDSAVKGGNTFFDRRDIIDEYGWRNFGDLYADHEAIGHNGSTPLVAHYNNQYDVIYGASVQYARSGDLRWFHLMNDLAKHVIDIDIYHTQEDRQAFNGGMFWHTEHYADASTATHRAYSKASLGSRSRHLCGGGPSSEHNYTTGLLHYYFLTGDDAARDVVLGLADWVIDMDRAANGILSLFDRRPTGLCSTTVSRDYHGPGRGCGNSLNALIDAHLLTREKKYLAKAEQLIQRSVHPKDDIQKRNFQDVEYRWSYTVFFQVLGKYLDFKVDKNEIDYMYCYARESLIHYAKWMLDNEVPYKRVLDRVKIPTETWPAQDIRKSNVFKYAAKYSIGPIREVFLRTSDFFFNTGIKDLLSFKTCTLTRPVVLLMTNAFMQSYFELYPNEFTPQPAEDYEFGQPQKFTPQLYELYTAREKLITTMETLKTLQRRIGIYGK